MEEDLTAELISIGEFARRARLTPRALRIYDRIGLLRPTLADTATGYRRYDVAQVRTGQIISLLRGAGLSLADIRLVLRDLTFGADLAVDRLDALLTELDHRHANRKLMIRHVQTTLREGADLMFRIETRHVQARRLMSIQRRLHAPQTDSFVREAKAAFTQHLGGVEPAGPFMLIFHGVVDEESDGPIEAVLGCPSDVQPTDSVGVAPSPNTTRRTRPLPRPNGPTPPSSPPTTPSHAPPRSRRGPGAGCRAARSTLPSRTRSARMRPSATWRSPLLARREQARQQVTVSRCKQTLADAALG